MNANNVRELINALKCVQEAFECVDAARIALVAAKKATEEAIAAITAKKAAEEAIAAAKKAVEEADKKAAEEAKAISAVNLVSMYMDIQVDKPFDLTLYAMLIEHAKLIEAKNRIKKQSEKLNVLYNAKDVQVITQLYKDISEITAKIKHEQNFFNILIY